MVRRLKEDIREVQGGFPRARGRPDRRSTVCPTTPRSSCSRACSTSTAQLREERFAPTTQREQAAAGLLVVGLQQRLLSSIEAFARTPRGPPRDGRAPVGDGSRRRAGASRAADAELLLDAPGRRRRARRADRRGARGRGDAQVEAITAAARGRRASRRRRADAGSASRAARPDGRDRRARRATSPMRRSAGWSTGSARTSARLCRRSVSKPSGCAAAVERPPRADLHRVPEDTKRYLQQILEQAIEGTDRADERIAVITGSTSGAARRRSSGASTPTRPRTRCAS